MTTTVYKTAAGAALAFALTAGVALAQTVPTVIVTPTTPTSPIAPGTQGATVATIQLVGNQGGTFRVESIPLALTGMNGGIAGNLTNCQAFNAAGLAVSGSFQPQAGTNTITFNAPLEVTAGATSPITLRCNVTSSTTPGSTFAFSAGAPTFSPGLAVNLAVSPNVAAGQQNAAVALITLDATRSGQPVRLSTLPIAASFTGATNLTGCQVRNIANLGTSLNTGGNVVATLGSGQNTFTLDTPLTVNAGTATTLVVTCNVGASAPTGGTVAFAVTPGAIAASSGTTGATITPIAGGPAGTVGVTSGTLTFGATGSTPGVPNTGAGGATTGLLLGLLAVIGAAGSGFLLKRSLE